MNQLVISLALTLAMACPVAYAHDTSSMDTTEQGQKEYTKKHKKKKYKKKCHGKKRHGKKQMKSVEERIDEETELTNR